MKSYFYQMALNDFQRARQRAALSAIVARFSGKSSELLSYEEVLQSLRQMGSTDRGVHEILVDQIVGSVGRYSDFDRTFLPLRTGDAQRWAQVSALIAEKGVDALPPIEVYQVGDVYFVKDGNHRVSIARQMGLAYLTARVTEVRTRVPLDPNAPPGDLIIRSEYANFLESTRLDQTRPDCNLTVSIPGQYASLEAHIEVHRYFREAEIERDIPYDDAAMLWYDEAYLPIVHIIREQGILRYFPDRTETDLYLWLAEHRLALQRELGWQIDLESTAARVAAQFKPKRSPVMQTVLNIVPGTRTSSQATGDFRREKLLDRYSDRMFADILVPIRDATTSWPALDQALLIAQREQSDVHGLLITRSNATRDPEVQNLRAEFEQRCAKVDITGQLGVESGDAVRQICDRASMTDLVVFATSRPMGRLDATLHGILHRCVRPVLVVPGAALPIERALLAYDGGGKAREALFVAAYLSERWEIPLVVVSVGAISGEAIDYAERYLDVHEVQAKFVQRSGSVEQGILATAEEHTSSLIITGAHGSTAVREAVLGSDVTRVLRESRWPVLVCR